MTGAQPPPALSRLGRYIGPIDGCADRIRHQIASIRAASRARLVVPRMHHRPGTVDDELDELVADVILAAALLTV